MFWKKCGNVGNYQICGISRTIAGWLTPMRSVCKCEHCKNLVTVDITSVREIIWVNVTLFYPCYISVHLVKCIVDGTYSLIIMQTRECIHMMKHTMLFVVVRISDCRGSRHSLVADEQKSNQKELDGRPNKTMNT